MLRENYFLEFYGRNFLIYIALHENVVCMVLILLDLTAWMDMTILTVCVFHLSGEVEIYFLRVVFRTFIDYLFQCKV